MERGVEPHVDVVVAGILVDMKERPGTSRKLAARALSQLGKLAKLLEESIDMIKVVLRRVPHA